LRPFLLRRRQLLTDSNGDLAPITPPYSSAPTS
jgi:hypothetical protein